MKVYGLEDEFYFGKFKGKTVKEVLDSPDGRNYIKWAIAKPILSLDSEAQAYARTGKMVVKPKVDITTLDFWQRVIIQGPYTDIPF